MEHNALGSSANHNHRNSNTSSHSRSHSHEHVDTPGHAWTRTWINRLDEASSSMCPSSQASTPLQTSQLNDQAGGLASPSQSSDSLSDAEMMSSDEWKVTENVKWKDGGEPTDVSDDVTRSLPTELLLQIIQMLPTRDLVRAMLVSKAWCLAAFPLLWQKPPLSSITQFASFVNVLAMEDPLLPYATTVRRLVFNGFARHLTDELFSGIGACRNLERLTLPGATRLTSKSLYYVFGKLRGLIAIDLAGVDAVDDYVVYQIANGCPQVQGLNLAKCDKITDDGVMAIAARSSMLRRIKLSACKALTDKSVVALTRACPLLLELDLAGVNQLSNDSMTSIFFNVAGLRELRMNENETINSPTIPDLHRVSTLTGDAFLKAIGPYPWYLTDVRNPKAMALKSPAPPDIDLAIARPITTSFDQLRVVDFTSCKRIGDQDIDNLVTNAPQLRSVTLAKCTNLTNDSIHSISRLGKHLHYLHLGHVSHITDDAVIRLVRSCTRLRYVDLANCSQLTDLSVIALATSLPKLRRVGLVKVVNITDYGIETLAERGATLERLHLSYCDNISLKAISFLLNRLPLLMHLSLTGVTAFKTPELQQFCRPPPETFNPHQRASFCVYSGPGVKALRQYLDSITFDSDSSPHLQSTSLSDSLTSTVSGQAGPDNPQTVPSRSGSGSETQEVSAVANGNGNGFPSASATLDPAYSNNHSAGTAPSSSSPRGRRALR